MGATPYTMIVCNSVPNTCGGYPCFFFAAMDFEAARMVYGRGPSAMQKRCKITRCVYKYLDISFSIKSRCILIGSLLYGEYYLLR